MSIPVYKQPLDENLSLLELIRVLNAERELMRASDLEPLLLWSDTSYLNSVKVVG